MISRFKEFFKLVKSNTDSGNAVELGWVFAGQLVNMVLSFVILKLLSKMGTADYGIYALVVTITVLLSLVLFGPALQGFLRFYYDYLGKGAVSLYLSLANKFLFFATLLLIGITVITVILACTTGAALSSEFFLLAGLFIITGRIGEFFNAFLNLIRKRKENALLQGGEKITTALLLLALILSRSLNLVLTFAVLSLTALLFASIKIMIFRKHVPKQITEPSAYSYTRKEIKSKIVVYVFPFILWGISGWLQLNGEKWIIADLLSTSVVGIYAVMVSLVTAFIVVPSTILADFTTPIIFQNYSNPDDLEKTAKGYVYINLNVMLVFAVTIFAALVTALWGEELITLISSKEFAVYWYLLPLLCFGTGMFYTGQAFATLGLALNQPRRYLAPKILSGILSVIFNYILISVFGIAGAAFAVLLTGMIYLVYIIVVNKNLISSTRSIS